MKLLLAVLMTGTLLLNSARADERSDRLVDRAALTEVSRAIKSATDQIAKTRRLRLGAERERQLTLKLGDLQYQRSGLEFRVGIHQKNDQGYKRSLGDTIATLTRLIHRFPEIASTDEMPHVLWIRARAFEDLERSRDAESDYQRIAHQYSQFERADSARMALGRIRMDRAEHRAAIDAYSALLQNPDSPFYPIALQQVAWCHANLGEVSTALERVESALARADAALSEQLVGDYATFSADGIEQAALRFTVEGTWAKLRGFTKSEAPLLRMAKLLRSKSLGRELTQWSDLMWRDLPSAEATVAIDHLLREFADHQQDLRTALFVQPVSRVNQVPATAWEAHRRLYSGIQGRIQELLKKNSEAAAAKTLPWLERLESSYVAFIAVTGSRDPRRNAAEIDLLRTQLARVDSKGIRRKFVVTASSVGTPKLNSEASEAYSSILSRIERVFTLLPSDQQASVRLERARLLYESGSRAAALEAFAHLLGGPKGPVAERRAALAALLDQAIADEDRTSIEAWVNRRQDFASDPEATQLLDQAQLQRELLVLKKPTDSAEKSAVIDRLAVMIEKKVALPPAVVDTVATEQAAALLKQAGPESLGRMRELLSHLSKPNAEAQILLAIASGDLKACDGAVLCTQWERAIQVSQASSELGRSETDRLLRMLLRSGVPSWERTLTGIRLLPVTPRLGFRDRSLVLRAVARGWKDLHPLLQWKLMPRLIAQTSDALAALPSSVRTASPLSLPNQASEAHFVHRMDLIRSFENLSKDLQQMGILETALPALEAHGRIFAQLSEDSAKLGPQAAPISQGSGVQAVEIAKVVENQRTLLAQSVTATEGRVSANRAQIASSFDPSQVSSQVWVLLRGAAAPEVALILWNQGARHAASQVVATRE